MDLVYKYNCWYPKQTGRQYLMLGLHLGFPSGSFSETVRKACNALLNSDGGIIVFGVEKKSGIIKGVEEEIDRSLEDLYKLALDRELRNFNPSVSQDKYRMNVIELKGVRKPHVRHIIEIKVSAGGELFEDGNQKVYIVRHDSIYGPLIPKEIKDLVLITYKEEILMRAAMLDKDDTSGQLNAI